MLAEALAWLLGTALDAPLPTVAACLDEGERSWLSEHLRNTKHWDSDLADLVTNYDGLGRVLAVDAIVINEDRHAGNILVEPAPDATSVRVWGIDFGVSVIGYPKTYAARRGDLPSVHNHARGLPLQQVWEHAIEAAERASRVDVDELRGYVVEACEIAGEKDVGLLLGTLVERCRGAPALVAAHLAAIAKLR